MPLLFDAGDCAFLVSRSHRLVLEVSGGFGQDNTIPNEPGGFRRDVEQLRADKAINCINRDIPPRDYLGIAGSGQPAEVGGFGELGFEIRRRELPDPRLSVVVADDLEVRGRMIDDLAETSHEFQNRPGIANDLGQRGFVLRPFPDRRAGFLDRRELSRVAEEKELDVGGFANGFLDEAKELRVDH